jgi:hypothetical protein
VVVGKTGTFGCRWEREVQLAFHTYFVVCGVRLLLLPPAFSAPCTFPFLSTFHSQHPSSTDHGSHFFRIASTPNHGD